MSNKRIAIAVSATLLSALLPTTAFASAMGIMVGGGCFNYIPMASQSTMISNFNTIINDIIQNGVVLTKGQAVVSSTNNSLVSKLRATIKNAAIQSSQLSAGMNAANSMPVGVIASGNQVQARTAVGCQQALPTGPAAGYAQGTTQADAAAVSIANANASANRGGPTNYGNISKLALPGTQNYGSNTIFAGNPTSKAGKLAIAVQILTNPTPLPKLTKKEQATAAGKAYEATKHVQEAKISLPQSVLTDVALMNAPIYPLKTWALNEIKKVTKTNSTLSTSAQAVIDGKSSGSNISQNTYLHVMNTLYAGNPNWWHLMGTTPSNKFMLQQTAQLSTMNLDIAYQKLLLTQKEDAMLATSDAQQVNSKLVPEANSLRVSAISEAVHG
jgi:hypothetical protein